MQTRKCNKCGRKITLIDWYAMEFIGNTITVDDETYQNRNCKCGTTLTAWTREDGTVYFDEEDLIK
jgi:hypothetical protein